MSLTVLFDLDDTLLHTNLGEFIPEYFRGLSLALSHLASHEKISRQIRYATHRMTESQDPGVMLSQIFADHFYGPLGTTEADCRENLIAYYKKDYPKLRKLTQQKPSAQALVKWCQSRDYLIAIATNPLFPETATRQRIQWAGLAPEDFILFSTYDNFHFTKPNLTYYAETLGYLGWPEEPVIMIGDNLGHDLLPIETMGFETFWIDPEVEVTDRAHGSLDEVKAYLENSETRGTFSLSDDPSVQRAILRSTPAVFDSWFRNMSKETLLRKPSTREWSILEVLWHLIDFENKVYKPQWEQLLSDPEKPITPKKSTAHPTSQQVNKKFEPQDAVELFINARLTSLSLIEALWDKGLFDVSVQHSIFSKTKISELVRFSAKHDRMHLQQCSKLLNI